MIVCLVLYILSYILSFHYRCVSVRAPVRKFVCLCVLPCIYCHTSYVISSWMHVSESTCMKVCMSCPVYIVVHLMLFHHGCVSVRASVWKFVCLCFLSCIYCRTSYVISWWMRVSESIWVCMKVCMFICLVLYILSQVLCCFIIFKPLYVEESYL